ncbi:class I SAM-dependent methyltransferase [Sphingomonas sp. 1P06PA]|uniref:class I SAM-dependent methyltransferase n=1 Tax=Sphingomonas sp. 1P06PA TaxID=554121 RepID=UPI0039A7453F
MTSRESTPFLPRALDDGRFRRDAANWAQVLAFGAIQWPWLLKSLWGGRAADRVALLDRLGLAQDALPNLGSWKADVGFLTRLVDHVLAERPEQIVELGAGASSLVLARAVQMAGRGRLTSYDQHGDFVAATGRWIASHGLVADIRHAPLTDAPAGWPALWYDLAHLPEQIDLLVIDGPPWTYHPLVRGAAETLFDRVAPGGTVMLDDAARPGERLVALRWRKRWPQFAWQFLPGIKGTLVGTRLT